MKNIFISVTIVTLFSFSNPVNAQWQQTNGPDNYNVFALVISGNNIFAGTDQGVYLSDNNGTSWTAVNNGFQNLISYDVPTLLVEGNNVFAGTLQGAYVSTNNGSSWAQSGLAGLDINSFAASVSGDTLFAGTAGEGVYISTDNGFAWQSANTGFPEYYNTVYSLLVSGKNVFAGSDSGVYLSENMGANWTAVNNGIPKYDTVYSLVKSGSTIFAGTDRGVYLSTNNGSSWSAINNGLTHSYVNCLAISNDTIFAGIGTYNGGGIYRSVNNGTNWTAVSNGFPANSIVYSLALKGNEIFGGVWGDGIYLSANKGTSWAPVNNGFSANTVVNTLFSYGDTILAGTEGNGIYLSGNSGATWIADNNGDLPAEAPVECFASEGNNIFAGVGNYGGGVYLSTDNGITWTEVSSGSALSLGVYSLAVSGNNIFAGTSGNGVFMSSNNGASWTHVSTGLPDNFVGDTVILALAIKGDTIFASNQLAGVYLSTNNGASWTEANNGLPLGNSSLYPTVNAFAIIGNKIFAATDVGLYLSTNNAINWTAVTSGLGSPGVNSLFISGDTIFAATGSGAFMSADSGTSWASFNTGFPVNYTATSFAMAGNTLFAGTTNSGNDGLGVWSYYSGTSTGITQAETSSVENITIYPNPNNGKFTVGNSSNIKSVTIYNLLGECIYMSLSAPSASPFTIDLSGQPKGMYFIQLQTTGGIINKKVVIN